MRFLLLLFYIPFLSAELSFEEKIAQLFMVHVRDTRDIDLLVRDLGVGGIIYYNWANDLSIPEKVKGLSCLLQKNASIPLLIGLDHEGGGVCRLPFLPISSQEDVGMQGDPDKAYSIAKDVGLELKSLGINLNFAPVVDVYSQGVFKTRCFSSDPHQVALFAEKSIEGYEEAGILCTLKHFPGHGAVNMDTHIGMGILEKSLDQLFETDLYPFRYLALKVPLIMTAHILAPCLDPDLPATFSSKTLQFLRKELGFSGAIITDSLIMDALIHFAGSIDEAAIMALQAGCDILLFGGKLLIGENAGYELTALDIQRIHAHIAACVEQGLISQDRIEEAYQRVAALKALL